MSLLEIFKHRWVLTDVIDSSEVCPNQITIEMRKGKLVDRRTWSFEGMARPGFEIAIDSLRQYKGRPVRSLITQGEAYIRINFPGNDYWSAISRAKEQ